MDSTAVATIDEYDVAMLDLEKTQKLCVALMRTPHYAKMGDVGIFAIVQKARALGISPLEALNGGMYFVNGKVELTANTMSYLIRAAGHSVQKDPKSDRGTCILHGKRKDNGDRWTCSFSIEDARRAGIYKNQWEKYPEDMLYARALSRLARQLFPDTIKGCYVEGEISNALPFNQPVPKTQTIEIEVSDPVISEEQLATLEEVIGDDDSIRQRIMKVLSDQYNATSLADMPAKIYSKFLASARMIKDKQAPKVEEPKEEVQESQAMEA